MKETYGECLKFTLKYEGEWSNHPADPGGATMKGVTQRVYDAYRVKRGAALRSVREISDTELQAIYRQQYWAAVKGDELPSGVDLVVFDYGVNSGPSRAVKDLQRVLGVGVDGIAGLNTLAAARGKDAGAIINGVCDARLRFYKSLKTWKTFGVGWAARIAAVRSAALGMVHGDAPPATAPVKAAVEAGKAPQVDQAKLKTAEGAGLTAAGIGAAGNACMSGAQQVAPHIGESLLGRAALAAFVVVMLIGGILVGYSYLKRVREAGGIGGLLNVRS